MSAHDRDQQALENILDLDRWTVLRAFDGTVARLRTAAADPDVIVSDSRLVWSFYDWRKRLRESAAPVRFALVERRSGSPNPATSADIEIVLTGGEQLRIRSGVDGTLQDFALAYDQAAGSSALLPGVGGH